MGAGWGAAALVGGMVATVLLGLVLVTTDDRVARVRPRVAAVLLGGLVVAGCAWLTVSPVRSGEDTGSAVCGTNQTGPAQKDDCATAVVLRRVLVFVPLTVIGAGAGVALVAPAWRGPRPDRAKRPPGRRAAQPPRRSRPAERRRGERRTPGQS